MIQFRKIRFSDFSSHYPSFCLVLVSASKCIFLHYWLFLNWLYLWLILCTYRLSSLILFTPGLRNFISCYLSSIISTETALIFVSSALICHTHSLLNSCLQYLLNNLFKFFVFISNQHAPKWSFSIKWTSFFLITWAKGTHSNFDWLIYICRRIYRVPTVADIVLGVYIQ